LTTDPLSPPIDDPYVASYAYAGDMPTRYTDPSGKCFILCGAAVGAVVGGFISAVSYGFTAGEDFSAGGLIGHALVGAAAGAVAGATLGLASGIALPALETVTLQATGGYVGGIVGLAGSRLLGDPITAKGAAIQMGLGVAGAGFAPRMTPGSSFWDQLTWKALFGTPQAAGANGFGIGAGLAGTK
jgi:hypothetical protein